MRQRRKASNPKQPDLLFITDVTLRKKIIEAIETISGLYLVEKDPKYPVALVKEIRRTIVLYAASIVEAILLFLYKKSKYVFTKIDYKEVHTLPSSFQLDPKGKLVFAKQIEIEKDERELMLDVLLKHFSENNVISKTLEAKIKKAKDIRNTFHLSKSRLGLPVSTKTVKISTDAVFETIIAVKDEINKRV